MIVLVTGGSTGIGLAITRRLAAAGHDVYAASRNPRRSELPAGVVPVVMDISSPESTRQGLDAVLAGAGRVDVLVNNAGTGHRGAIEETGDEECRRVFDVNFFGPLRLARLVVPVMRSQGGGRIINITSMNDVLAAPFGGLYSASKAALSSASAVLGAEVAHFGIRVSVVAPGLFRTGLAESMGTEAVDPGSQYRAALEGLVAADADRLAAAADPDDVARAVEECLAADDPPARIVVGRDAEGFDKLLRKATPDEFAAMLRDYVGQLIAAGAGPSGALPA